MMSSTESTDKAGYSNVDGVRQAATKWSLASDAGLLALLEESSTKHAQLSKTLQHQLNSLLQQTEVASVKYKDVITDFLLLSSTQFVENRVQDDELPTAVKTELKTAAAAATQLDSEQQFLESIDSAVLLGSAMIDQYFDRIEVRPEDFDESDDPTFKPDPFFEPKDPYVHHPLPVIIGSQLFCEENHLGLRDASPPKEAVEDVYDSEDEEEEVPAFPPRSQPTMVQQPKLPPMDSSNKQSDSSGMHGSPPSEDEDEDDEDDLFASAAFSSNRHRSSGPAGLSSPVPEIMPPTSAAPEARLMNPSTDIKSELARVIGGPKKLHPSDARPKASDAPSKRVTSSKKQEKTFEEEDDDDDADLFRPPPLPPARVSRDSNRTIGPESDGDDSSDSGGGRRNSAFAARTGLFRPQQRGNLFDDDDDSDDEDLFASVPKAKSKPVISSRTSKNPAVLQPYAIATKKPDVARSNNSSTSAVDITKKPAPSLTFTKPPPIAGSLFDDDLDSDSDNDIFASVPPKTRANSVKQKPPSSLTPTLPHPQEQKTISEPTAAKVAPVRGKPLASPDGAPVLNIDSSRLPSTAGDANATVGVISARDDTEIASNVTASSNKDSKIFKPVGGVAMFGASGGSIVDSLRAKHKSTAHPDDSSVQKDNLSPVSALPVPSPASPDVASPSPIRSTPSPSPSVVSLFGGKMLDDVADVGNLIVTKRPPAKSLFDDSSDDDGDLFATLASANRQDQSRFAGGGATAQERPGHLFVEDVLSPTADVPAVVVEKPSGSTIPPSAGPSSPVRASGASSSPASTSLISRQPAKVSLFDQDDDSDESGEIFKDVATPNLSAETGTVSSPVSNSSLQDQAKENVSNAIIAKKDSETNSQVSDLLKNTQLNNDNYDFTPAPLPSLQKNRVRNPAPRRLPSRPSRQGSSEENASDNNVNNSQENASESGSGDGLDSLTADAGVNFVGGIGDSQTEDLEQSDNNIDVADRAIASENLETTGPSNSAIDADNVLKNKMSNSDDHNHEVDLSDTVECAAVGREEKNQETTSGQNNVTETGDDNQNCAVIDQAGSGLDTVVERPGENVVAEQAETKAELSPKLMDAPAAVINPLLKDAVESPAAAIPSANIANLLDHGKESIRRDEVVRSGQIRTNLESNPPNRGLFSSSEDEDGSSDRDDLFKTSRSDEPKGGEGTSINGIKENNINPVAARKVVAEQIRPSSIIQSSNSVSSGAPVRVVPAKASVGLFSSSSDDDDDDLFSVKKPIPNAGHTPINVSSQKRPSATASDPKIPPSPLANGAVVNSSAVTNGPTKPGGTTKSVMSDGARTGTISSTQIFSTRKPAKDLLFNSDGDDDDEEEDIFSNPVLTKQTMKTEIKNPLLTSKIQPSAPATNPVIKTSKGLLAASHASKGAAVTPKKPVTNTLFGDSDDDDLDLFK